MVEVPEPQPLTPLEAGALSDWFDYTKVVHIRLANVSSPWAEMFKDFLNIVGGLVDKPEIA